MGQRCDGMRQGDIRGRPVRCRQPGGITVVSVDLILGVMGHTLRLEGRVA